MFPPIMLCVLTDLHLYSDSDYMYLKKPIEACEMLILTGDIVNFDTVEGCPDSQACHDSLDYMMNFVTDLGKPFLYTLGNHDSTTGKSKLLATKILGSHELHAGQCNTDYTACVHKELKIGMLYSGDYNCLSGSFYGCPTVTDADFINEQLNEVNLLFTHIPPPAADRIPFLGIKGERACHPITKTCSWAPKENVLPSVKVKYHLYGHDHDNLYISKSSNGTRYVSLLKSGKNSYGPCFSENKPGYTIIFEDNISFHLFNSKKLDINNIPLGNCKSATDNTNPTTDELHIGLVAGAAVLLVGFIFYCVYSRKHIKYTRNLSPKSGKLIF